MLGAQLPSDDRGLLDVGETLRDKRILFVGATGFVGKVALSMFLCRYPGIGKMFVLVRPGAGSSSEDRFFQKVAASPTFDPIRERWGEGTEAFLREKCVALAGDVARPMLNFNEETLAQIGKLDAIINCAGLVSFNPSLETALRINVLGPKHVLDVARKTGAAVIHISTCFVAGHRDGEIWEDEPLVGYFPRKDRGDGTQTDTLRDDDFSVDLEIADCQRIIDQVKSRADDRAHVSEFRDKGAARLKNEGRDADDERTLKIAVQRERKMWVAEKLTDLGMERSQHWGWPNTYTYTKSLGDQVCAGAKDVRACIVRPAIVESAIRYPFPGWNEGFTTSAPLAFLSIKGHRTYPAGDKATLDIIPVDMVASGLIMATAATIAGQNELVYQLGSSDVNPLYMKRAVELLGLHKRRYFTERKDKGEGSKLLNIALSRMEPVAVSRERFDKTSAPLWMAIAKKATALIDEHTPRWGAPRLQGLAEHMKSGIDQISSVARQTNDLFQLFMPFIYEREYVFRCDHVRALYARLTPADQALLRWDPEQVSWRHYWLDIHMRGLEKWIFPNLEEEFKARPKSVYTYRDLLEMFEATTKHHRHRTAMRLLPDPKSDGEPQRYTYADLQDAAERVAAMLRERGVAVGDKVMLLSENRPEWGITYFGILKAGAVVVPVDWQSTVEEVQNLIGWARARAVIVSDKVRDRLSAFEAELGGAEVIRFDDLLHVEPKVSPAALVHHAKADELASLIFTSGTTGRPKGVMLSHRNFASLLSKLAGVFDIDKHDGLLSVLPMHHTFEFTAGFLMPLMRGAQITYMEEIDADALTNAFESGNITGMVGVPALWQMLHRRVDKTVSDRGPWAKRVFDLLIKGNRELRDKMPPALDGMTMLNWGKLLFWPVHQKFGGRLRLLISGGSALPTETMKALRGLGFNLFEGYGLTEAAPVLTVNRPGTRLLPGTVGEPLPGIDVRIDNPDAKGVGEVVATGPNVMLGYFENTDATSDVIDSDGWLHTGDLGRFDDDGRLYIVGRKKEMILGPSGENVYPDELEDLYLDSPYVKELSIVGLPGEGGGETVAMMVVPDYEQKNEELGREAVKERLAEHIKAVSSKLPLYKRVKVVHLTDLELPKTATRKVKRKLVIEDMQKLERLKKRAEETRKESAGGDDWIHALVATVANKPRDKVYGLARMEELGYDSLMYTELGVALEAAGVVVPDAGNTDLTGVETVDDLAKLVHQWGIADKKKSLEKKRKVESTDADEIHVPEAVATIGRSLLGWGQRALYERLLDTEVTGRAHIPGNSGFLVAANHASHLDMGLVKHALGDWGERLVALAAKDYFFGDPVKRAYFENFTNLVPMDRHGSLRESLRLASEVIKQGHILLIFPEGTRSTTGVMVDFKASIGYLALANKVDVLPMYLDGTHDAMPKGSFLPKRDNRGVAARIGRLITYAELKRATEGMPKSDGYREASRLVELEVRKLAPEGSLNRGPAARSTGKVTAESVMTPETES
ncbi:MAG: AMP-dependent synthetase and ligase [Myxococcales bacterium]|nr:AMP-dependent synthetase and ligase [Myxococcales bacterium]